MNTDLVPYNFLHQVPQLTSPPVNTDLVSYNFLDQVPQLTDFVSNDFLHQVPQLTSPPVNTHALAILSSVAGEALTKHLSKILPALMAALTKEQGTSQEDIVLEHCQTVSGIWRMECAR